MPWSGASETTDWACQYDMLGKMTIFDSRESWWFDQDVVESKDDLSMLKFVEFLGILMLN